MGGFICVMAAREARAQSKRTWEAHTTCFVQVCAVHMSLISQLERLGGLEEWALYVALHLPDSEERTSSARDELVLQLLHRHAPVWAASKQKQEFLTSTLGLPPAWLASALATFAAYNKDRASRQSSTYFLMAEGGLTLSLQHSLLTLECMLCSLV